MAQVRNHDGLAFLIIRFSSLDRYFLVSFEAFELFWNRMTEGGRKSVTLAEIEENGIEIKPGAFPRIDYLPHLHKFL